MLAISIGQHYALLILRGSRVAVLLFGHDTRSAGTPLLVGASHLTVPTMK